jgi:hypothetical protein
LKYFFAERTAAQDECRKNHAETRPGRQLFSSGTVAMRFLFQVQEKRAGAETPKSMQTWPSAIHRNSIAERASRSVDSPLEYPSGSLHL